ncbi:MAG: DUF2007 domain-containing protein [Bacteroidales bacterium]|jgi:hypothetical protein|nr:DUF2007 domain-containing protein [Bacteroidales bacterium]MDD4217888.1 DUF2007 domain-containing protein [Bacteroidales bacterium]MDY0141721.1 DUF2007 domain-containing protein [Bacteroidales bacterium]
MTNSNATNRELVYATEIEYLAELLKQVLEDNNINVFIFNRQDSSYRFGDIEVYVNSENLEKAKLICSEFENNTKIE